MLPSFYWFMLRHLLFERAFLPSATYRPRSRPSWCPIHRLRLCSIPGDFCLPRSYSREVTPPPTPALSGWSFLIYQNSFTSSSRCRVAPFFFGLVPFFKDPLLPPRHTRQFSYKFLGEKMRFSLMRISGFNTLPACPSLAVTPSPCFPETGIG